MTRRDAVIIYFQQGLEKSTACSLSSRFFAPIVMRPTIACNKVCYPSKMTVNPDPCAPQQPPDNREIECPEEGNEQPGRKSYLAGIHTDVTVKSTSRAVSSGARG